MQMHVATKRYTVLYSLLFGAIYTFSFSSCLPEPDRNCPPQFTIQLGVKDKNYFNASNLSSLQPMDETLPFKAYVGDISYQLQNIETGEILISIPSASVTDDHQLQMIDVTGVPEGRYRFIALGNTDGTTVLTEGPIPLHADNQEHRDTYLIHDTLNLSTATPEHALDMNRTKGLLLVLTENAPDSLGRIDEQISNLQQYIDKVAGYSGETSVSKSFTRDISPAATLLTWTAPTVPGKKSALQISLFAKNKTTPYMILPSIELNMKRNEISVIKVNFVPTGVEIWIYLYGNWQKLHSMDITIIN